MTATPNGEPKAPENNSPFEESATQEPPAPVETPPEQTEEQVTSEQPKGNAPKEAWVAFAERQGIDTEGLTVAQIKEKVATPSEEKLGEPLADVHHDNLPLSAVVGDVFAIVKTNPAGITVLELSMNGFIGVEPVAVPVAQASDIEKVIAELRTQAAAL